MVAVPLVPAVKVMPAGKAPPSVIVGVVVPVAVTVNDPAVPAVKVVDAALVMESDPLITVRVNAWLAVPMELVAVMVSLNVPTLAAVRVPVSVAVPLPLSVKATPDGRAPNSVNLGVGNPAVVTVKDAGCPTVKVVDAALVMAAAAVRSSVNAVSYTHLTL